MRGEDTRTHTNLPFIPPLHGAMEFIVHELDEGTLSISSSYASAQHYTASGESRTAGYAIFNLSGASAPIVTQYFSILVRSGIQNIFNKKYHNHLSTLRGLITAEPGVNYFLSITVNM